MTFDRQWIEETFPLLANHPDLSYLDSAASAQKPASVIEAMERYNTHTHANIHRGAYKLSVEATALYEGVRSQAARFIGAARPEEIIFTKGTTEGLNLLAHSFGWTFLEPGDEVAVSLAEHHSNILPWQQLVRFRGIRLKFLPVTPEGVVDVDRLDEVISRKTKLVSIARATNALGIRQPVEAVVAAARKAGARVCLDAAQSIPHEPLDVQALDVDFAVFSGHKMYGPTGIGVLYGRHGLLEQMVPYQTGGDMIDYVEQQSATFAPVPQKFEAGTQPIEAVIGLGAAMDFMEAIGWETLEKQEQGLLAYAMERLQALPYITVYGPKDPARKVPVAAFNIEGVHPHDAASILDDGGVAIRAGHHCAQPLMKALGLHATCRMSLAIYNTRQDIDKLVDGLARTRELLGYGS